MREESNDDDLTRGEVHMWWLCGWGRQTHHCESGALFQHSQRHCPGGVLARTRAIVRGTARGSTLSVGIEWCSTAITGAAHARSYRSTRDGRRP